MTHKKKQQTVTTLDAGLVAQNLPTPPKMDQLAPLSNLDGQKIQEMIDLNNTYGALLKQKMQYTATAYLLKIKRDQINKGQIQLPVMIQITRTISHAESNKEKVLKHIDDKIKSIELAAQGITSTMEHRRDEYIECVIRVSRLLGEKVKDYQIKEVQGIRGSGKQSELDEQKAIEKEFEKMMKEKA